MLLDWPQYVTPQAVLSEYFYWHAYLEALPVASTVRRLSDWETVAYEQIKTSVLEILTSMVGI